MLNAREITVGEMCAIADGKAVIVTMSMNRSNSCVSVLSHSISVRIADCEVVIEDCSGGFVCVDISEVYKAILYSKGIIMMSDTYSVEFEDM